MTGNYDILGSPRTIQVGGMCFLTSFRNYVEFVGRGNYSEGNIMELYIAYNNSNTNVLQDLITGMTESSIDNFMQAMTYSGLASYGGISHSCVFSLANYIINNRATIGIVQSNVTTRHAVLVLGADVSYNSFMVFDSNDGIIPYSKDSFYSVILIY